MTREEREVLLIKRYGRMGRRRRQRDCEGQTADEKKDIGRSVAKEVMELQAKSKGASSKTGRAAGGR